MATAKFVKIIYRGFKISSGEIWKPSGCINVYNFVGCSLTIQPKEMMSDEGYDAIKKLFKESYMTTNYSRVFDDNQLDAAILVAKADIDNAIASSTHVYDYAQRIADRDERYAKKINERNRVRAYKVLAKYGRVDDANLAAYLN